MSIHCYPSVRSNDTPSPPRVDNSTREHVAAVIASLASEHAPDKPLSCMAGTDYVGVFPRAVRSLPIGRTTRFLMDSEGPCQQWNEGLCSPSSTSSSLIRPILCKN